MWKIYLNLFDQCYDTTLWMNGKKKKNELHDNAFVGDDG